MTIPKNQSKEATRENSGPINSSHGRVVLFICSELIPFVHLVKHSASELQSNAVMVQMRSVKKLRMAIQKELIRVSVDQ